MLIKKLLRCVVEGFYISRGKYTSVIWFYYIGVKIEGLNV